MNRITSYNVCYTKLLRGIKGIEIDYWKLINEKLKKEPQCEIINENQILTQKVKENKNHVKFAFANYDLDKKLQTTDSITKITVLSNVTTKCTSIS